MQPGLGAIIRTGDDNMEVRQIAEKRGGFDQDIHAFHPMETPEKQNDSTITEPPLGSEAAAHGQMPVMIRIDRARKAMDPLRLDTEHCRIPLFHRRNGAYRRRMS